MSTPEWFPVMVGAYRDDEPKVRDAHPQCPIRVPYALVLAHERQAMRNHGRQSVETLRSRGGLDPVELWAVLTDHEYPWKGETTMEQAVAYLCGLNEEKP